MTVKVKKQRSPRGRSPQNATAGASCASREEELRFLDEVVARAGQTASPVNAGGIRGHHAAQEDSQGSNAVRGRRRMPNDIASSVLSRNPVHFPMTKQRSSAATPRSRPVEAISSVPGGTAEENTARGAGWGAADSNECGALRPRHDGDSWPCDSWTESSPSMAGDTSGYGCVRSCDAFWRQHMEGEEHSQASGRSQPSVAGRCAAGKKKARRRGGQRAKYVQLPASARGATVLNENDKELQVDQPPSACSRLSELNRRSPKQYEVDDESTTRTGAASLESPGSPRRVAGCQTVLGDPSLEPEPRTTADVVSPPDCPCEAAVGEAEFNARLPCDDHSSRSYPKEKSGNRHSKAGESERKQSAEKRKNKPIMRMNPSLAPANLDPTDASPASFGIHYTKEERHPKLERECRVEEEEKRRRAADRRSKKNKKKQQKWSNRSVVDSEEEDSSKAPPVDHRETDPAIKLCAASPTETSECDGPNTTSNNGKDSCALPAGNAIVQLAVECHTEAAPGGGNESRKNRSIQNRKSLSSLSHGRHTEDSPPEHVNYSLGAPEMANLANPQRDVKVVLEESYWKTEACQDELDANPDYTREVLAERLLVQEAAECSNECTSPVHCKADPMADSRPEVTVQSDETVMLRSTSMDVDTERPSTPAPRTVEEYMNDPAVQAVPRRHSFSGATLNHALAVMDAGNRHSLSTSELDTRSTQPPCECAPVSAFLPHQRPWSPAHGNPMHSSVAPYASPVAFYYPGPPSSIVPIHSCSGDLRESPPFPYVGGAMPVSRFPPVHPPAVWQPATQQHTGQVLFVHQPVERPYMVFNPLPGYHSLQFAEASAELPSSSQSNVKTAEPSALPTGSLKQSQGPRFQRRPHNRQWQNNRGGANRGGLTGHSGGRIPAGSNRPESGCSGFAMRVRNGGNTDKDVAADAKRSCRMPSSGSPRSQRQVGSRGRGAAAGVNGEGVPQGRGDSGRRGRRRPPPERSPQENTPPFSARPLHLSSDDSSSAVDHTASAHAAQPVKLQGAWARRLRISWDDLSVDPKTSEGAVAERETCDGGKGDTKEGVDVNDDMASVVKITASEDNESGLMAEATGMPTACHSQTEDLSCGGSKLSETAVTTETTATGGGDLIVESDVQEELWDLSPLVSAPLSDSAGPSAEPAEQQLEPHATELWAEKKEDVEGSCVAAAAVEEAPKLSYAAIVARAALAAPRTASAEVAVEPTPRVPSVDAARPVAVGGNGEARQTYSKRPARGAKGAANAGSRTPRRNGSAETAARSQAVARKRITDASRTSGRQPVAAAIEQSVAHPAGPTVPEVSVETSAIAGSEGPMVKKEEASVEAPLQIDAELAAEYSLPLPPLASENAVSQAASSEKEESPEDDKKTAAKLWIATPEEGPGLDLPPPARRALDAARELPLELIMSVAEWYGVEPVIAPPDSDVTLRVLPAPEGTNPALLCYPEGLLVTAIEKGLFDWDDLENREKENSSAEVTLTQRLQAVLILYATKYLARSSADAAVRLLNKHNGVRQVTFANNQFDCYMISGLQGLLSVPAFLLYCLLWTRMPPKCYPLHRSFYRVASMVVGWTPMEACLASSLNSRADIDDPSPLPLDDQRAEYLQRMEAIHGFLDGRYDSLVTTDTQSGAGGRRAPVLDLSACIPEALSLWRVFSGDGHLSSQEDAEEFLMFMLDGLSLEIQWRQDDSREEDSFQVVRGNTASKRVCTGVDRMDGPIPRLIKGEREDRRKDVRDILIESFRHLSLYPAHEAHARRVPYDKLDRATVHLEQLLFYEMGRDLPPRLKTGAHKEVADGSLVSSFTKLPPLLIFHIQRTAYDRHSCTPLKLSVPVDLPRCLKVPQELLRGSAAMDSGNDKEQEFEFTSAILHRGAGSTSGHYICIVQLPASPGETSSARTFCVLDDNSMGTTHNPSLEQVYLAFYVQPGQQIDIAP